MFSDLYKNCFKLLITSLLSLVFCLWWNKIATAQTNYSQIVNQGVELYQQGNITAAIDNWQIALNTYKKTRQLGNQTIILENLARAYQQLGQSELALDYWQETINNYRQLRNSQQLERSLTEQAQIYARLGQHEQAIAILCGTNTQDCLADSAISIARQQQDKLGEGAAWGSLGETYRLRGDYQTALGYLKASLDIAREINNPQLQISALNSLGNTYSNLAQVNYRRTTEAEMRGEDFGQQNIVKQLRKKGLKADHIALKYLVESSQQAKKQENRKLQLRAMINSIFIYYRIGDFSTARSKVEQALSLLPTLATTQDKIYATIDLAKLLQTGAFAPNSCYDPDIQSRVMQLLKRAASEALTLEDLRAQSFALGELGHVYECRQNYRQALKLSQEARWIAENEYQAKDSLYLWEWQTGRILKQQGNLKGAIRAYQQAITTLDSIRNDILTANRDIQFDFRDTVEPVYRELIAMQLAQVPSNKIIAATDKNLNSVMNVLDSFQLAELQNYFGNDCSIEEASKNEDARNNNDSVAMYYSIILPHRTAIIVRFPNGDRQLIWINKNSTALRQEVISLNESLVRWYDDDFDPSLANVFYDRMIKPFVNNLEQRQIKTLVFIQDGILRNLPMSALYDGQQYLIEQYAIANTPSLTVTKSRTLERQNLKVLALGLTKGSSIKGRVYPPLPQVSQEIFKIKQRFQNSKSLFNQNFSSDRLQQELEQKSYQIVHIASHAQFGAEPQDTFLITGNNQTLTITELDRIIRSTPQGEKTIELLFLTACETALGDERSSLGLAGVAVQAGVESAIASLWSLDDGVTPQLVEKFYTSLQNNNHNKAQALQTAQIDLINQNLHPAYWASFILIGDWQ